MWFSRKPMKGSDPQVEGGSTENVPPNQPRATSEHDSGPERFVIAKWLIFSLVFILIVHYGLTFALV
jgi:hypothetical protein